MTGKDDNGNDTESDIAQYPHLLVVYPFIKETSWSSVSHIAIESLKGVFLKQPSSDLDADGPLFSTRQSPV